MVYNVEQMGFNGWKESAIISYEQLIAAPIRIFTLVYGNYVLILWHQRSCGVFTLSRTLAIAVLELSLAAASTSAPVWWVSLQWGPDFFLCLCRPPSWKTTNLEVFSAAWWRVLKIGPGPCDLENPSCCVQWTANMWEAWASIQTETCSPCCSQPRTGTTFLKERKLLLPAVFDRLGYI